MLGSLHSRWEGERIRHGRDPAFAGLAPDFVEDRLMSNVNSIKRADADDCCIAHGHRAANGTRSLATETEGRNRLEWVADDRYNG